jgi:hypothetical protein
MPHQLENEKGYKHIDYILRQLSVQRMKKTFRLIFLMIIGALFFSASPLCQ